MKRRWGIVLLAAAATVLAGCSSGGPGGDAAPRVALLTYAQTDYIAAGIEGLTAAVEPAGGSVTVFSNDYNAQKGLAQCNDAITSSRFNAIVIATTDNLVMRPCVEAANEAGIVVGILTQPVGPDTTSFEPQYPGVVISAVITNDRIASSMVEVTQKACEGKDPCTAIVEIVSADDPLSNSVRKAIESTSGIEVVSVVEGQYDPSVFIPNFTDAYTAHPDADVVVSASDTNAVAILPVIEHAGGHARVVGNGGSRQGAKSIAAGGLWGTVGSFPWSEGNTIGKAFVTTLSGGVIETPGVDSLLLGTPLIVTKDNVADFTPQWGAE